MEDTFTKQLQYTVQTLGSPVGAVAIMVWIGLLLALFISPKMKWVILVLMMWFAAMSFYVEQFNVVRLSFPLDQVQNQGRNGTTAFLAALLLPAIAAPRGWRFRPLAIPLLLLFVFEMVLSMRIMMAGVMSRGALSVFIYGMMFIVLGWGASKWMQDWNSARSLVRCVGAAAGVYIVGVCYQLAANRGAIVRGSRLMGTSGNAQLAALLFSLAVPATAYVVARAGEKVWVRVLFGWILGMEILFLLWTGSRTGTLIALIGILLMFWSRIGRLLAVSMLVGVVIFLSLQIYEESTLSIAGMMQRGDTRSHVWRDMLNAFISSPLMGIMEGQYGVGENSYLSVAANLGLFGLLPLAAFVLATGAMMYKLFRVRSVLVEDKLFIDMVIGGAGSLLIGAFFEGYLLGTLTFPVFALYIYLALGAFALDAADVARYEAATAIDPALAEQYGVLGEPLPGHYIEQYN